MFQTDVRVEEFDCPNVLGVARDTGFRAEAECVADVARSD
jgi:hypothetical protein